MIVTHSLESMENTRMYRAVAATTLWVGWRYDPGSAVLYLIVTDHVIE